MAASDGSKHRGETQYQAEPGALFPDWPLVVLVDQSTWGTAEWLAAALQDNHRAILVGMPSASATGVPGAGVKSTIPVGDGTWSIVLTTGRLERGDGRPLAIEAITARALNLNPSFVAAGDPDAVAKAIRRQLTALAVTANGSTLNADTPASKQAVSGANSKYGVKPDHTVGGKRTMPARPRRPGKGSRS